MKQHYDMIIEEKVLRFMYIRQKTLIMLRFSSCLLFSPT